MANADAFLDWPHDQPWMLLRELAHGYHHQFLEGGYDNPLVSAAHAHAREEKLYDEVLKIRDCKERHYGLAKPARYFAEATEAHFGTNHPFSFVQAELEEHDPEQAAVIRKQWSVQP